MLGACPGPGSRDIDISFRRQPVQVQLVILPLLVINALLNQQLHLSLPLDFTLEVCMRVNDEVAERIPSAIVTLPTMTTVDAVQVTYMPDLRKWIMDCSRAGNRRLHFDYCSELNREVGPESLSMAIRTFFTSVASSVTSLTLDYGCDALSLACHRQHMDAFDEAIRRSLHRTAVVRIDLTSAPTGKRKQYDKQGEEMKYGRME